MPANLRTNGRLDESVWPFMGRNGRSEEFVSNELETGTVVSVVASTPPHVYMCGSFQLALLQHRTLTHVHIHNITYAVRSSSCWTKQENTRYPDLKEETNEREKERKDQGGKLKIGVEKTALTGAGTAHALQE